MRSSRLAAFLAVALGLGLPAASHTQEPEHDPVFQFRFAEEVSRPGLTPMSGPEGTFFVEPKIILSDVDIAMATSVRNAKQLLIHIRIKPEKAEYFRDLMEENIGRRMALLVGTRVVTAGVIAGGLGPSITVGVELNALPPEAGSQMQQAILRRWPQ